MWKTPGGKGLIASGGLLYLCFFLVVPIFILVGYPVALGRALARDEPIPRPWRIRHAIDGLKMFGVIFVFALPLYLLFIPVVVSIAQAPPLPGEEWVPGPLFFAAILIVQPFALLIGAVTPAWMGILASTGRMRDCFRPSMLKGIIRPYGWSYLLFFVLSYAAQLIAGFGIFACLIGVIFTGFYAATVQGHLAGQLARSFNESRRPLPEE